MRRYYTKLWPKEVRDYVEANAATMTQSEMLNTILDKFGREYKKSQLEAFYKNHHLRSSYNGRFVKGQESHNKGKKMSPEQYEKARKYMFKRGGIPKNRAAIGTEVITTDGYHMTKIAYPSVWEFTHRIIYEKAYGPIPEGYSVIFKDSNRDNLSIDNLIAVSKTENWYINQKRLRFSDPEKTEAAVALARLVAQTRKRKHG